MTSVEHADYALSGPRGKDCFQKLIDARLPPDDRCTILLPIDFRYATLLPALRCNVAMRGTKEDG